MGGVAEPGSPTPPTGHEHQSGHLMCYEGRTSSRALDSVSRRDHTISCPEPIGRASCRTISTAFECKRLDHLHHHLGDRVRAEPGPVGRSLHLKVPNAALEQRGNTVRWYCSRC